MACPCELRLGGDERKAVNHIAQKCISEARRFEKKYSRYLDASITSQINSAAGERAIAVDPETSAILQYAGVCYAQSQGMFDITSGVLRRIWNSARKELPGERELRECIDLIGWAKVELSKNTVFLPKKGMELDFGGVVKEYAVDAITLMAQSNGIAHGLVNLGGDIGVIGPDMEGKPWSIGVVNPGKRETAIATIQLYKGAVATSGAYERHFEIDGKKYSHLINPKTGWPVESLQSVTVAADTAIVAGSISSIALLNDASESLSWLENCGAAYFAIDRELQCYGHLAGNSAD